MANDELRRLANDIPNNPDLLTGIVSNAGDLDATINYFNDKGYGITRSEIDDLVNNLPQTIDIAANQFGADKSNPVEQKGIAVVVVAVAVAVWVYVISPVQK